MAKILYAVNGEGHGHATRSAAVIEHLKKDHDVVAIASNKALTVLKPLCKVHKIPGVVMGRSKGKISFTKTAYENFKLALQNVNALRQVKRIIEKEQPDLIITDFEPLVCRVAKKIPIISIDNQTMFLVKRHLPKPGQELNYLAAVSIIRLFYTNVKEAIITHFHKETSKKKHIHFIEPIVRESILIEKRDAKYNIVYLRSEESVRVIDELGKITKHHFDVFGIDTKKKYANITMHGTYNADFAKYLAQSNCVICTAGLSLISEALVLGKPVMALPEKNDYEQYFNAQALKKAEFGTFKYASQVKAEDIALFLAQDFKKPKFKGDGAKQAAKLVNQFIARM